MRQLVLKFLGNESGATAIEYALIAAGVSIAIVAGAAGIGLRLKSNFVSVSSGFN